MYNMASMQEFLKVAHAPEFFINSKCIELHREYLRYTLIRLMTKGSLGNGNHSHWKFCNSVNLQCALCSCNLR